MALIAHLFQILVLLSCFCSVGLTTYWLKPQITFPLHFCFAPLAAILILFCFEHFVGLGQFPFLWILLLGWIAWLIHREPSLVRQLRDPVVGYFLFGFGVCFFWRFSYPDIWGTSEMLPDLDHLVSWSEGRRLPALDHLATGELDTPYYIFQYYAGGLIHRALGTTPGVTYHLAYCMVVALGVAGFGRGAQAWCQSRTAGVLAAAWICWGGNGATLITPWMVPDFQPHPLDSMRFVGSFAVHSLPGISNTGLAILKFIGESSVDAPMEYYSYIIWLGDFHPSLSSLGLLGLLFMAIGYSFQTAPNSLDDKICVAGGVLTAVLMAITNTWITPLQIGLILVWLAYRFFSNRWNSLIFHAACWFIPITLIFPFFSKFSHDSSHYPIFFEFVPQPPTVLNWLTVMGPCVVLWALSLLPLLLKDSGASRSFSFFSLVVGAVFLWVSYYLHVHDVYGGTDAIFNTTLKWWPWIYAAVAMIAFCTLWNYRFLTCLLASFVLVLTISANSFILLTDWKKQIFEHEFAGPGSHPHVGALEGYAWFMEDSQDACTEQILQTLPLGVVLESAMPNANDSGVGIGLFSGDFQVGAWVGHEQLWRGDRVDLDGIGKGRDLFYAGKMPDPDSWVGGIVPGGVDYILWLQRDNIDLHVWPQLNEALKKDYDWHGSDEYNLGRWGIWVRKNRINHFSGQ